MIEDDCTTQIPFSKTGYFSDIICDYLSEDIKVNPFYSNFPNIEGFKKQIDEKRLSVRAESRTVLTEVLNAQ